jgi:hypothetical protein
MQMTIEIDDELFESIQPVAHELNTTVDDLVEKGLQMVLAQMEAKPSQLPPLETFVGGGLTDELKNASWEQIRDEIYRGHGA